MRRTGWRMLVGMGAVGLVLLTMTAATLAQEKQEKIDVTGTWAFEVQTENGTGTPTLTFKQDGEKLAGHYSSQMLGEAELTGTVKGQAIEFSVAANVQGNAITLTFTGTVETRDSMKGKVSFAGFGEGTFTGTRK
jgi:hypothetical protein